MWKSAFGKNLSYPDEEIIRGSADELKDTDAEGLCAAYVFHPQPENWASPHVPDDAFIRGEVPMTKEEIRAVSIAQLQLSEEAVVYDVGAGTGSVSVEAARCSDRIRVYAIEKKPAAVQLIRESGALRELWVPELDRIFPMGPESGELVLLRFESRAATFCLWEKWRSSRCKKTASALRKSRILWTENQKTACRAISRSRWILPHRSSNSSIRSGTASTRVPRWQANTMFRLKPPAVPSAFWRIWTSWRRKRAAAW